MKIPIDQIIPDPNQPRKTFKDETIDELKLSLKESNQVAPLLVRLNGDNQYMIITGERRYRAAKKSGLKEVECVVRDNVSDGEARIMQLIDEILHEDIPHDNLGVAFRDCCKETNISQRELARKLGKDHSYISDHIAIVEKLAPSLQTALKEDKLQYSEARNIATGVVHNNTQMQIAKPIIEGKVGGTKAREYISKAKTKIKAQPTRPVKETVKEIIEEVVHGIRPTEKTKVESDTAGLTGDALILMMDFKGLRAGMKKLSKNINSVPPVAKSALDKMAEETIQDIQTFRTILSFTTKTTALLKGGKK